MTCAYIDTSYLVAILFKEPGHEKLAKKLACFATLISSNLLEAEVIATFKRENFDPNEFKKIKGSISWVLPNRVLSDELQSLHSHGYLKGADLWHVACALYVKARIEDVTFLTLDKKQQIIAKKVGFKE